jgi:hypothetical protein
LPDPIERAPTFLESALAHARASSIALLVVVPAVSWLWIVVMARDMYGPMTGASAWMMTSDQMPRTGCFLGDVGVM